MDYDEMALASFNRLRHIALDRLNRTTDERSSRQPLRST